MDVIESRCFQFLLVLKGFLSNRHLCVQEQSSTSSLLFEGTGRQGISLRRPVHRLDRDGSVHTSSNFSSSSDPAEYRARGLRSFVDCFQVASTDMVPSTTAAVGRCPNSSPRGQGHSEDAGNTAKISQCSLPQVNCMDIIKQRCQKEGFSEKAADLVSRDRRQSTLGGLFFTSWTILRVV